MEQARLDGKDAELKSLNMQGARTEAERIVFNTVEQLLESTNTKPQDIDILIVNCSLFCPTPSLSAMIVNKFTCARCFYGEHHAELVPRQRQGHAAFEHSFP